jgi:N-acetylglucosaminyldiphosphoundecaprenol N-acetyl-beta-D-mannosaminyltransferase
MNQRKQILGVNIDFGLTYEDVVSQADALIQKKVAGKYICTTNPEFVIDAQKDSLFKKIINDADLSVPDGAGLLYANEYLKEVGKYNSSNKLLYLIRNTISGLKVGLSLIENSKDLHKTITGLELTDRLAALAEQKGYTVYLLGGRYGSEVLNQDLATDAANALRKKYPKIKIVGSTSKFNRDEKDDLESINYIQSDMQTIGVTNVDILLVAYNHGYQDKWISRNAHKIPATLSIGVGRTFAVLAGYWPKEPLFIEQNNLGWLYRLITQPSRLKRIYKAFPLFPLKVFINNIKSPIK